MDVRSMMQVNSTQLENKIFAYSKSQGWTMKKIMVPLREGIEVRSHTLSLYGCCALSTCINKKCIHIIMDLPPWWLTWRVHILHESGAQVVWETVRTTAKTKPRGLGWGVMTILQGTFYEKQFWLCGSNDQTPNCNE